MGAKLFRRKTFGEKTTLYTGIIYQPEANYTSQNNQTINTINPNGNFGGDSEIKAAKFIKDNITKPVCAFIAGKTAPKGKRMGHAGAIISGGKGTAQEKIEALQESGVSIAPTPATIAKTLSNILK